MEGLYCAPTHRSAPFLLNLRNGNRIRIRWTSVTNLTNRSVPHRYFVTSSKNLDRSIDADDDNAIWVDNWGAGVSNFRLSWRHAWTDWDLLPYIGVYNAWDRKYIGSVTINGAGGRVLEPSPRRNVYVGMEIGFRTRS